MYDLGFKSGYTLVTLPCIVTPYRDNVDETRARVTYQKLVTRLTLRVCSVCCRYLAVASKDDTVTAGAGVDVQRHVVRLHLLRP